MKKITIDAKNKKLGRLASEIAIILQGKNSPKYEARLEGEDSVLIKNVDKIEISGKKFKDKIYYAHSTMVGHLKKQTLQQIWEKQGPAEILKRAVFGMLPKNRLQAKRIKRLIIEAK